MAERSRKLDDLLRVLRRVDSEFVKGRSIDELASELGFTAEELVGLASVFSVGEETIGTLSKCGLTSCLVPMCVDDEDARAVKQVATGVLIEIGPELFILTASHVVNSSEPCHLVVPAVDGMVGIQGWISHTIPDHQPDREDRLDFAYIRLASEMRDKLHPSIKAAKLHQLAPAGDSIVGDLYTFAGFPWRKSGSHDGVLMTELVTFTGLVTSDENYEGLGFNRREHIVVRFGRKRTYSSLCKGKKISPHPQGVSGGIAIKWPRHPKERCNTTALKICGIAHSFYESRKCLVATNIRCLMNVIASRHPHLRRFFEQRDAELSRK